MTFFSTPVRRTRQVVAACLMLLLAACQNGAERGGADASTLRVGDQGKVIELPLRLSGQDKTGPYKIEFANFADGPHMNAAFIADAVDVGFMGDTPLLLARAARIDLVVLASRRVDPNTTVRIVARPGTGIRTLADVRGKRVAVTKGTALQGLLLLALDSVNLRQKDVTIVDVPNVSLASTLQSGSADATILAGPQLAGYLLDHADAVQLDAPAPMYNAIVAPRKVLADPVKAALIRDFVARLTKSGLWIDGNRAAWRQAYYFDLLHQPPRIADYIEKHSDTSSTWKPVDDDFAKVLRRQEELLTEVGALPDDSDLAGPLFDPAIRTTFNQLIVEASS